MLQHFRLILYQLAANGRFIKVNVKQIIDMIREGFTKPCQQVIKYTGGFDPDQWCEDQEGALE